MKYLKQFKTFENNKYGERPDWAKGLELEDITSGPKTDGAREAACGKFGRAERDDFAKFGFRVGADRYFMATIRVAVIGELVRPPKGWRTSKGYA